MKIHLEFNKEDFNSMRYLEQAVKKQLGNNVYIGTGSLCLYFPYTKTLTEMLRPYSPKKQLEFDLVSEL